MTTIVYRNGTLVADTLAIATDTESERNLSKIFSFEDHDFFFRDAKILAIGLYGTTSTDIIESLANVSSNIDNRITEVLQHSNNDIIQLAKSIVERDGEVAGVGIIFITEARIYVVEFTDGVGRITTHVENNMHVMIGLGTGWDMLLRNRPKGMWSMPAADLVQHACAIDPMSGGWLDMIVCI